MKIRIFKVIFIAALLSGFSCPCFAINFSVGQVRVGKDVKSIRQIRDQNVVRQSSDYSCGAAGLSTILSYDLHDPISEREIMAEIFKTVDMAKVKQRNGFSLLDLKKFAEHRGYKVVGYKMDIDFLRGLKGVALVPIKFKSYRHFVVVKGVIGERVFVADPAMGNMIMSVEWFKRIWQEGVGVVFEHPDTDRDWEQSHSLLRIQKEDFVFMNGRNVKGRFDSGSIRTNVFPTEF